MALRDIVEVQITRQTASLTRVGFGTLAFVWDSDTALQSRVKEFGSPDEIEDDGDLTPAAKAALSAAFMGDIAPTRVKAIYRLTEQTTPAVDETFVQALTAAQLVDEDWYAVAIQSRNDNDILAVAGWIEARHKVFIAATNSVDVLNPASTTDVGALLLASSYSRTALIFSATALSEWPDTAWAGSNLPNDPGSISWAFKPIRGATGQVFTSGQITALENKRVSRIEVIQGLSRSIGGYTSEAGAFIDIIRGLDWLRQSMAEDVFAVLVNAPKVPFTNEGIAMIETAVLSRLQIAVNRNVLVDNEQLKVTTPDVSQTTAIDRANRTLRDVRFTAQLAGAIHRVVISGTVSV